MDKIALKKRIHGLGNGCSRMKSASAWMSIVWKIIRFVLLLGICYLILYPFLVKLLHSFFTYEDFLDPNVRFIPRHPTLANYPDVVEAMGYWSALANTAALSLLIGAIQMVVCAVAGYGFARFKFRGNGLLFLCVVMTLVVPPQTVMIPLYRLFFDFPGSGGGLIDTFWPMILLALTGQGFKNGLYIFIFRQLFKNMPAELEDAAYIDGCGYFTTFVRVMLPSAVPTMATVFLFGFSWQWTDLFYTRLFNPNTNNLVNAIGNVAFGEPIMSAMRQNLAALLIIAPLFILFLFAQRAFTESIERSGIVG